MARQKIQMIKEEVKQEVENIIDFVFDEVELIGDAVAKVGDHTIYLKSRFVQFKDGVAKVGAEVAEELRKLGLVK